jgi:outer membrane protein assembly factor BamB
MWADLIVEIDNEGNRIWEWHAYEHLDPETDVLPPNFSREEWSHGNTIVPLEDDRVMVSFRSISTVGIIDKKSGDFVWKLSHDVLAQQHDPSMLPNGNILIFDNGLFRKKASRTYSRVIEVNPNTNEIVWEYRELPFYNFYSPHISGARRLHNGNTLITEGAFGRMFQVTSECEVVWEYINPYFTEGFDGSWSNSVFRANHYITDQIPHLS